MDYRQIKYARMLLESGKYIHITLISLIVMSLLASCKDHPEIEYHYVSIVNDTEEKIFLFWLNLTPCHDSPYLAEDSNGQKYEVINWHIILDPGDVRENNIVKPYYEDPDPKIGFIILKQDTFARYSTEEILSGYVYDRLYILTYDELEKMGFKIRYTGD